MPWGEYAVLAVDVPATGVKAVVNRAVASDRHMSVEAFADLMADRLAAPTQNVGITTTMAAGVEL
jgi:hypothetical protein